MLPVRRSLAALLGSAVLIIACGPPTPPKHLSSARFVDDTDPERARVSIMKQTSAPMVVDWNPENRADLEVTSRKGPALVRFDQQSFELLPDCHAQGGYSYVGVTPKEQHVNLRSRAELQTNLPLGAFKLEGLLDDKGALSVVMRMVGKQVLDRPTIERAELSGRCAGATHYVSALTVGAFRFAAGASREIGGGASAMGFGAKADSQESNETLQVDGDFLACDGAEPTASRSPSKCSAILRIEIVPLERPAEVKDERPRCGEGMRWDGESCVTLRRVEAEAKAQPASGGASPARGGFECDPKKPDECVEQCRLGNLPSCVWAGAYIRLGAGGQTKDPDKAAKLWAIACKSGYAPGCTALAQSFVEENKFGEALAMGRAACLAGDPAGCNSVAIQAFFGRGVKEDRATAFALWQRACTLRDWSSCSNAGVVIDHGIGGVTQDQVKARKLFEVACSSPDKAGCVNLAGAWELGEGGPTDIGKALELYLSACDRGESLGCTLAGLLAEERRGKDEHRAKALELYEKGCGMNETGGCLSEDELRKLYAGKYDEEGIHRRACDGANQPTLACYNAAIGHERGYAGRVDLGKATSFLKKACDGGLKKACRAAKADSRPARAETTPL